MFIRFLEEIRRGDKEQFYFRDGHVNLGAFEIICWNL